MVCNDLSRIASALERIADAVAGPKPNYAAAGLGGAIGINQHAAQCGVQSAAKAQLDMIQKAQAHQYMQGGVQNQQAQGFSR